MAYTDFTPKTRVQEGQDATCFRVWDESIWNGEENSTTSCNVTIFFYKEDGSIIQFDVYPLIDGVDTSKFEEYLSRDGHIINMTDLKIGGTPQSGRFEDGYYIIRLDYSEGDTPVIYDNPQAFLAKSRCMSRKLPAKLSWPLTNEQYQINRDIFQQRAYLEAAENAADLAKLDQFLKFMEIIKKIFSNYEIENCW